MRLTLKIEKAINMAAQKHAGQKRKADGLPYIVHPFAVAWIVGNYTDDEEVIAAALLHDVLEDVPGYRLEDMQGDFGSAVAEMVKDVSEDKDPNVSSDEKATWEERKRKYLAHLQEASGGALLISAADKIHNLHSMVEAHRAQGEAMWEKFNSPKDKKLWFYEEVLKIVRKRLKGGILQELEDAYRVAESEFNL